MRVYRMSRFEQLNFDPVKFHRKFETGGLQIR